jgi:NAD(P)-dependent dehydrogenase (short-subunit alcohol dehydrogenase family)
MTAAADLSGKVAVVTGAGSGIGRATALLLARRGARVHAADLNLPTVESVSAEAQAALGSAVAHGLDVTDPEAVEALAAEVFAAEGGTDILHNNAGIGHGGNIEAITVEDWQRVIAVNLLGVAYGVQAFAPRMLSQGRPATIVNTASLAGLIPVARMAPYCASKFGVVGMSEALNAELSPRGIRVVAVCPGLINTAIVQEGVMRGELGEAQSSAVAFYEKHGATPESVAEVVLKAVARPRPIVPAPALHVTPVSLLHRISPRLAQPVARGITKLIRRG